MLSRRGIALLLACGLSGNVWAEDMLAPIQTARIVMPLPDTMQPAAVQASARDVIESLYGRLLQVMQSGSAMDFSARYDALQATIERSFDLPLMTRFAAGTGWLKADAVQQQKMINAFSDFSIATYASRFKAFDGESFQIVNEKPAAGGGIIVETRLVPSGDPPVTLNYMMRQDKQGAWRINDVYLEATISEMATRRAEFGAVIRDDGVDGLIANIHRKAQALRQL